MQVILEVPEYKPESGLQLNWENDFIINITVEYEAVVLSANKDGLISLANHLLNLAQDGVQPGTHFHLDEYNSLEAGSKELIIQKVV